MPALGKLLSRFLPRMRARLGRLLVRTLPPTRLDSQSHTVLASRRDRSRYGRHTASRVSMVTHQGSHRGTPSTTLIARSLSCIVTHRCVRQVAHVRMVGSQYVDLFSSQRHSRNHQLVRSVRPNNSRKSPLTDSYTDCLSTDGAPTMTLCVRVPTPSSTGDAHSAAMAACERAGRHPSTADDNSALRDVQPGRLATLQGNQSKCDDQARWHPATVLLASIGSIQGRTFSSKVSTARA